MPAARGWRHGIGGAHAYHAVVVTARTERGECMSIWTARGTAAVRANARTRARGFGCIVHGQLAAFRYPAATASRSVRNDTRLAGATASWLGQSGRW